MGLAVAIQHKLHDQGYHMRARPLIILFTILNVGFLFWDPYQTLRNYELLGFFSPLWVPYIFGRFAFIRFVQSRRANFIANQNFILLELRMPRDSKKTPLAMETIFSALHVTSGETTWWKKYILGNLRPWFSFEIVSLGGRIHFYVWLREGWRRSLESFFYGQYPDMEIIEAEDYSRLVDPVAPGWSRFGNEFAHTKVDPYPIKTYVDYGLDKAGAEPEEITDPMAQLIEFLGSIGPKEQLWLQFIIRQTGGEKYEGMVNKEGKPYTWRDEATAEIDKLRAATVRIMKRTDPTTGQTIESEGFPNPSKGQSEMINAIERNISKQGFDVGIRSIYTAPDDSFQGSMITPILHSMFKPFNNESYNGIKLLAKFSAGFNDYPWEDVGMHHRHHLEELLVEFYRRRCYFHPPYVGPWMVMSSEELATIYHVPGAHIATPSLPRIQSATSGAPSNLPT